ncbi:hypothetical protein FRUB_07284 [Fimbriiglobus ruber]|uniref:Uncharacterized protein n=1 Tax=Fimbriiglobus ruber TaxID=1908690 RepID=A0A225DET8_9BACT|nr:hypothetical protein FRUB_07284 [Fimbriiglobus ruber]
MLFENNLPINSASIELHELHELDEVGFRRTARRESTAALIVGPGSEEVAAVQEIFHRLVRVRSRRQYESSGSET